MDSEKSGKMVPNLDPEADCMVITPPDDLRKKAVTPSKGFSTERNAINRAEKALEELSEQFGEWMDKEVEFLTQARDGLKENGINESSLEKLFLVAHDLRGQAATLGFPCAAPLCNSLCHLIEAMPDKTRIPDEIIDHHVNAVRAVVRENIKRADDMTALALIKKLRGVTEEFLQHEIKSSAQQKSVA